MIIEEFKTQTQSPTLTDLRSSLKLMLEWCLTYKQMYILESLKSAREEYSGGCSWNYVLKNINA